MNIPYLVPARTRIDWATTTLSMPESGPSIRYKAFYDTPFETWWRLGRPQAGDYIVDVGCGYGRMAVPLVDLPGVRYLGLGIIHEVLDWARKAFEPWGDRICFSDLGVSNGRYNPERGVPAEDVRFPVPDAYADIVLAISIFTHIERLSAARRYLREMHRILKPGGRLFHTWFFAPPNLVTGDSARTVFPESEIKHLLSELRLRTIYEDAGLTEGHDDQREFLSVKP